MKPPPPFELRCEYLRNPLGVDCQRPRLSWLLVHPKRNKLQKAYRIIVSSSRELAEGTTGDVWDSGMVNSPVTSNVSYQGTPLQSRQRCSWRVQWWDSGDSPSEWSEVATFEMGLLRQSDWVARWISKKECTEFTSKGTVLLGEFLGDYVNCHALYLRKEFTLTKPVAHARAYVCGLGFYELRINGARVGDRVLDPAQTDYRKGSLYSTYDVTPMLAGKEVEGGTPFAVGAILGNGRHIKNYGYGHPVLIVQIVVEHKDGTTAMFVSNRDWKVAHGPLQENGLYYGERYDSRAELHGWDQPGYAERGWEPALEVEGYELKSQLMPPIRVVETRKPKRLLDVDPRTQIHDCGVNFAGWVRISVRGERGTEVRLRHAELLNDNGTLNTSPNQNAEATDTYILSGGGVETFEPRFTYHGFRYFEIFGSPMLPKIISVEACIVHSDVEPVGSFHCSNNLINGIHRNVQRGQLSNLMSIPTDCTQRDERQGWLGDAHLVAEESMFNFDMAGFFAKFLNDIRHSQKDDGSLPDVVPPYTGRLYPADPAWSSAYISIAWYVYWMYGDLEVLADHFETMRKYLAFLQSQADGNIITTLGKYGDWCPPGSIAPKRTPVELTATWFYYHDALLLSRIARVLNREKDHVELSGVAENIRSSFNRKFLIGNEYTVNRFAPVDRSSGQTSNALPLYLNMVPSEKEELVLGRLLHSVIEEQDYHLDTGILGSRYLLDVLTDQGHADAAYKVAAQRTYPGWGYMVEEGATSLWERWEKITGGGMNSHNHIMLGSVDAWFYRALAGISCLKPGWTEISIKPHLVQGLEFAEAEVRTVKGIVHSSWHRTKSSLSMAFSIPVGCVGQIYFPMSDQSMAISEGGRLLWVGGQSRATESDAMLCRGMEKGYLHFECGSGDYHMTAEPNT